MLPAWTRARDVLSGEDAVKAAGERYLPRLDAQTDEDYLAYLMRGCFFNATARTADGYVGLIFRRAPLVRLPDAGLVRRQPHHHAAVVIGPGGAGAVVNGAGSAVQPVTSAGSVDRPGTSPVGKSMAEFGNDVDMRGTSLYAYAKGVVGEVVGLGRAGTLIDWNSGSEARVYAAMYRAEDIRNWRVERVDGRNQLTLLVLAESVEVVVAGADGEADEFNTKPVEQLRVLRLTGVGAERGCLVEVWRKVEGKKQGDKEEWEVVERLVPTRRGRPLPLIPFVFHGCRHSQAAVDRLPMGDIISLNLDHYRLDADYKHGVHFTALPTAWVSGFSKDEVLRIGSSAAWATDQVGAAAGFLEFHGAGLTTFERAKDHDERSMAALGARVLDMAKNVGESATAMSLRFAGQDCILAGLAGVVSGGLSNVLRWVYWWNSSVEAVMEIPDDDVLCELSSDYRGGALEGRNLLAVVNSWKIGAISNETLLDNLRRGLIVTDGRTDQEEQAGLVVVPGAGSPLGGLENVPGVPAGAPAKLATLPSGAGDSRN